MTNPLNETITLKHNQIKAIKGVVVAPVREHAINIVGEDALLRLIPIPQKRDLYISPESL